MTTEWKKPEIKHGKLTEWNWMVLYPEHLILGKDVDIGAFTLIQAQEGIAIGSGVQIGGGVKIYSVDTEGNNKGNVIIHKGVRIGANTVIMPGCEIEHDAVIGALSFLKANTYIKPYEMWAGCPAKRKKRIK